MALDAALVASRTPATMELALRYSGLPLSGLALGDDQLGASLKAGVGRLDGKLRIVGDDWSGKITLEAANVAVEPKAALAGPAAGFARAALAGVKRFTLTIGISGREDDLHFALSSDLGQTLANGMKNAFSGELARQRQALEAKVDALYAAKARQLQAQTDDMQKKLLAPLDKQKARLDDQLRRAVSSGLGKSLPGLERFNPFK